MKSVRSNTAERKTERCPKTRRLQAAGVKPNPAALHDRLCEHYLGKLHDEREHLLNAIKEAEQRIRELDLAGADQANELVSSSDREYLTGTYNRHRQRLNSVIRNFERIQDGTFGLCACCNNPIGKKRLEVMPSAQNCIGCQQELEQASFR